MQQTNDFFCEIEYLLRLVGSVVNEKELPAPPESIHFRAFCQIAGDNAFTQVIYPSVETFRNQNCFPAAALDTLKKGYQIALAQDLNQQYELEKLLSFCEEQEIFCVPLKGSVLKRLYPQSAMRYMGDIDVWVEEKGFARVADYLKAENFVLEDKSGLHDEYSKPPYVALELHKKLVPEENRAASFFNRDMISRAESYSDYRFVKTLTLEDQYVYLIDHTAKHFYGSGITPRMLLDFYLFHKRFAGTINWDSLSVRLSLLHYETFERRLRTLAQDWFSPEGAGIKKDAFSLYVLQNGSFGQNKNFYISRAVRESGEDAPPSKIKYILRRLFPSYKMLRGKFPVLEKKPYFTPLMFFPWWATWFDTLFIKKKLDYKTLKHVNDIDRESTDSMRALYEEMELEYRKRP